MTAHSAESTEEVSKFAIGWLSFAFVLAIGVYLLLVFRKPVLDFGTCVWPFFDII